MLVTRRSESGGTPRPQDHKGRHAPSLSSPMFPVGRERDDGEGKVITGDRDPTSKLFSFLFSRPTNEGNVEGKADRTYGLLGMSIL